MPFQFVLDRASHSPILCVSKTVRYINFEHKSINYLIGKLKFVSYRPFYSLNNIKLAGLQDMKYELCTSYLLLQICLSSAQFSPKP